MCRLFGFRSVIPSQVHRSLMAADNALGVLSEQHPDGWGVAFYVEGAPHVARSPSTAGTDKLFHRVSGVVASETVLAHVRKATTGEVSVLNCHPFQYGRWTMAHNGDVRGFASHREALVAEVAPKLRRYVLGETDSEVAFFVFLTRLARGRSLSDRFEAHEVMAALDETAKLLRDRCDTPENRSTLTFIVTDGSVMAAHQGGKELHFSTHKTRCADRDHCASLSPECEAPTRTGRVNHFILSSEPLAGENVWNPLADGEVIGVDWDMKLVRPPASGESVPSPVLSRERERDPLAGAGPSSSGDAQRSTSSGVGISQAGKRVPLPLAGEDR